MQHALVGVGDGGDAFFGAGGAVFGLEQALEHPECQGGFQGGAGLGDHAQIKVLVAQPVQGVHHGVGGEAVAHEDDIRVIGLFRGAQQVHGGPGAQVGSADAHDHQGLGPGADAFAGGDDLLQLAAGHIPGKGEPACEVRARAGALGKGAVCRGNGGVIRAHISEERGSTGQIDFDHRKTSFRCSI